VSETRKLAAILVADIVGYSRLAGADEDRILARLRTLRSDLIDPILAVHHGRVVKRTGDGAIVEFRSVVDAVRCAIEVQSGLAERNAGLPPEKRIEYRVGIHLGDVVEEEDGDLMGDGVNIAARLEGVAKPGTICLSEQAYWQVKGRLDLKIGPRKNAREFSHPLSPSKFGLLNGRLAMQRRLRGKAALYSAQSKGLRCNPGSLARNPMRESEAAKAESHHHPRRRFGDAGGGANVEHDSVVWKRERIASGNKSQASDGFASERQQRGNGVPGCVARWHSNQRRPATLAPDVEWVS
jgi:hypothetical protein